MINKFFAIPALVFAGLSMFTACASDSVDGNPDYFRTGAFTEENDGKSICYLKNDDGTVSVTWDRVNTTYFMVEQTYEGEVTVPATVTHDGTTYQVTGVDDYAFYSCSKLTSLVLSEGIKTLSPKALTRTTKLTNLYLPTTLTSMETLDKSLLGSMSALASVHLPGVKTIGDSAVYNRGKLTSVEIPSTVETIGVGAFARCSRLTSITLPASVTAIGEKCFDASKITTYHVKATVPPTMGGALYNASKVTLYVPAGSLDAYKNDPVWGKCKTIKEE